jgi:antitoxin (DNA-binding transcriptional repressor) of toxin-antitoxin stability system
VASSSSHEPLDPPAVDGAGIDREDPVGPLAPIGVRELRNQVAGAIRRAHAGERLIVTVDGVPRAQLGPLRPDSTGVTLWDLTAGGLIEPPQQLVRSEAPAPIPLPADVSADRLLDAARGT